MLCGCAFGTATISSPLAGLSCVDDSLDCVQKRKATLSYMTNDPTRAWVRQSPTPLAYASGVRLFAFKKTKSELSCDELKIGHMEADAAPKVLRSAEAKSLSPPRCHEGSCLPRRYRGTCAAN